ncbi:hypothetical protein ACPC37_01325 [Streptomyces griseoincarnatus]
MAERLTFTLAGRDELSRVMNGTADSADRLRLRLAGISADADGSLRDLQGRFLSLADAQRLVDDRTGQVRHSMTSLSDEMGKVGDAVKANLISLLPAAIPMAAGLAGSAAVLAGQLGAVGVAAGAYALALGPQVSALAEAVEAQTKYQDAVDASGATSQEAIKAQVEYQRQLAKLPQPTQEAAVAVGILKDNYQEFSDSLAGDVMAPFTKGVAVANSLLPTTAGLAKGTSAQLDRLITLVGGAISTPGFDALNSKFTSFANDTLDHGIDKLTVFLAKLESGQYDGGDLREWWDYAQQAGPVVWDTLDQVADALLNVLEAGSGIGVGALDVINFLSGIVSAVPPDAIATVLQLAIAIKAVKLAAAGAGAAQAGLAALGVQIGAMRAAAAGAPGALAGTTAAIGTLSKTAKLALAGTGIGLLLITLDQLSSSSRKPQPDVDKLASSLMELGQSGKVSGEALRFYGKDLDGLGLAFQRVIDPEGLDQFQQSVVSFFGMDSTPVKDAKEDVAAFDEALASLVSGGNADLAAAALENTIATLEEQGYSTDGLRDKLTSYNDALAAQALEQELAAQSMGLFGEQAQQVQAKLDSQKASADGLRQSIQALNDVHRQGLGGMIGFEAAIDAATKAAQENAGVLDMQGGKLVLNTEAQRTAATALNDLAAKTDEAAASARESGESWETVNGIYARGREQLIATAQQMGLTKSEAKALADQILATPDKTAKLRGDMEDLEQKLAAAKQKLRTVPDSRKAQVRAEIDQLERQIEAARRQLNGLDGKTATTYIVTHYKVQGATGEARNLNRLRPGSYADGGQVRGEILAVPFGGPVVGPGTATSDSVPAWLSNGEYVIRASAVERYGLAMFDALNAERFAAGGYASGGISYSPTESATARISLSTVSSWYDADVQRLRDAWKELNEALRAQAKQSTAATRRAVAEARKDVAAADKALGLRAGSKVSGFSLTGYQKNLADAVRSSAAWERNLQRIGKRAGEDVEETLRGLGESGRSLVASLAKASSKQFADIVKNLRRLAPQATATLADYTNQLNRATTGSRAFQTNLLKLAAAGHGDLARQLAGQGDADAIALAAAAVKSPSAAAKASAAVKASSTVLTGEELEAATLLLSTLAKKGATVEDVVKAGVSWPMLVALAPRYAKQIKAQPGGPTFVRGMKERGIALAEGGLLVGPGTSTSDSIPLWGSHGEYMVKAAAVARYGTKFMDALNDGRLVVGRPARPGLPAAPPSAARTATADRPSVTYNLYPRQSVISALDLELITRQEEARMRVGRPE